MGSLNLLYSVIVEISFLYFTVTFNSEIYIYILYIYIKKEKNLENVFCYIEIYKAIHLKTWLSQK